MKCKAERICLALLLAVALAACSAGAGLAAGASVAYEGGAEKFVFLPDDDLFVNFKGVLPGDVLEQKIAVKNTSGAGARLYLRADPVGEAGRDFLNQLRLRVKAASGEIFDAQAGQLDGLSANALLGTFKQNGSTELTVTLSVPIGLDNRYMDMAGTVPWVFRAEGIDGEDDDTPDTGDWFNPALWSGILAALAGGVAWLALSRRRRARKQGA